jgi:hypothetical protein
VSVHSARDGSIRPQRPLRQEVHRAGTFGLVTSILYLHSPVVLQFVLPARCSSGADQPRVDGDPAWQILFLPEVR